MGSYVPNSMEERQEMLEFLGLSNIDELFNNVPDEVKLDKLNIPSGKSEMEVYKAFKKMAGKNKVFGSIFRGAGSYNHYIPSVVKAVASKERFVTAYTPYQPEISQGILQAIFEYQTIICELTGMDASNASVYDGASAAAEAAAMCADNKRKKILVSATSKPDTIETIKTYSHVAGNEVVVIPAKNGETDMESLKAQLDDAACFYVEMPNYNGIIEDYDALGEVIHGAGGKFIMGANPMALSIFKTPADFGADIAVGEAQPLGMPMSFGGPYLGYMACKAAMTRKLPGRIVGETTDSNGKRAFVLTLQAREQHIRRDKASSNVCSNQALCAFTSVVYVGAMGSNGMENVASQCYSKAHYAADEISKIKGFDLEYNKNFFNEFVTKCPVDTNALMEKLEENDILGGLPVEGGILWCVTEMNSKEEIDRLCEILREVA
ncbi:aminomethyl-transferring glycine dehydrogenase subunit GcvPA [Tyzzerella sp. OttesenSCG-928-J15]|nr:aminomethyl-transferring glycine dehydrogenase subunit GcvPA [Tyzzerella sp. OttesenSCG-928-J15]